MIQSYLFDPVQVPSPAYVNEINSFKLDEDNPVKLKSAQSSEILVHRNDLQKEGLKRTASRHTTAGGPLAQGSEKTDSGINGIGPAVTPQPAGDPGLHQEDQGFWTSPENSFHPNIPFLKEGGSGEEDSVHQAPGEPQVTQNGVSSRAPSTAEHPAWGDPDHGLQIPAPDYPHPWDSAVDCISHREQDSLSQSPTEAEPQEEFPSQTGKQGLHIPSPMRSWDSFNKTATPAALSISFLEEAPAPVTPVTHLRNGWTVVRGSPGARSGEVMDEDAAVAEALAALEAATAGEDEDEGD